MIVRIATEGQFRLPDEAWDDLKRLDAAVAGAVEEGDAERAIESFQGMLTIVGQGRPLADDEREESDFILPPPDSSIRELRAQFADGGILPSSAPSGSAAAEARSWLPGYAADTVVGEDLTGIGPRVSLLTSVLAAKRLETPLAIGIFGDWGSGKSFFMRRVQEGIAELVEHSARAAARGAETYYCSNVRQVTFNAWLYSDSQMWPSLAAQVFRSVSGDEPEAPQGETPERKLDEFRSEAASRYRRLAGDRHIVEVETAALDARIDDVREEIAAKRAEVVERTERWSGEAGAVARTAVAAGGARRRVSRLRRAWAVMGRAERAAFVAVVVVGLALAVAVAVAREWVAVVVAALLPLGAVVVALGRALNYVDEVAQSRLELADLNRRLEALNAERDEVAARRGDVDRKVERFRARSVLPEFAREQADRWSERAEAGTITEIRMRFEEFSGLISENLRAIEAGETPADDVPPIERVIVYVDDLDRCQHRVVVEVLEAIKLLLSLPHFAVVVGVDSRWLFRALELNFHEMMQGDGGDVEQASATPQNYLEKIFQYSLVIPPMTDEGFQRLVQRMLPVEAPVIPESGAPAGSGAEPERTPEPSTRPAAAEQEPDLTPRDLLLTPQEIEFIGRLGPMFTTPRAAKRLVNVYRLLRVAIGSDRLLPEDAFQAPLALLAISLAYPAEAGSVYRTLAMAGDHALATRSDHVLDELLAPDESERWPRAAAALGRLSGLGRSDARPLGARATAEIAAWIPETAEFSFHPWGELVHR